MIASLASAQSAAVAVPLLLAGLGALPQVAAADSPFKVDTRDNIIKTARTLAEDVMALYPGEKEGEIPGIISLPPTEGGGYYWWQGAVLMASYIDYWHLTGDDSYNDVVTRGILHQKGDNNPPAFMPANWTTSMGNDDQCMWATAAMIAAENGLPAKDGEPEWLELAENAFATQASSDRHDDTCGGGLRWQIPLSNRGYDYKNTLSNACYLTLAARLARYTGNDTYADIAAETWDWLTDVKFINEDNYAVYDGAFVEDNCSVVSKAQFSVNSAILLHGAAFMYNHTNGDKIWRDRVTKLTNATLTYFFPSDVAFEPACESSNRCNPDQITFRNLLIRYLASTTQLSPFVSSSIRPVLRRSAEAAVKTCTGGDSGRECGFYNWSAGEYVEPEELDGKVWTVSEQLNVLAAVSSLLVDEAVAPATDKEGGGGGGGGDNNDGGDSSPSETEDANEPKESDKGSAAGRSEVQILSAVVMALGAGAWVIGA